MKPSILFFVLSLIFATASFGQSDEDEYYPSVGEVVPDFTFETIEGDTISIQDYRGQTVLIVLFGTKCPPCMKEMKEMETQLFPKQEKGKFTILAVGVTDSVEDLKAFRKKKGYELTYVSDGAQNIFHLFAPNKIPRTILVNHSGEILYKTKDFYLKEFEEMVHLIDEELEAN